MLAAGFAGGACCLESRVRITYARACVKLVHAQSHIHPSIHPSIGRCAAARAREREKGEGKGRGGEASSLCLLSAPRALIRRRSSGDGGVGAEKQKKKKKKKNKAGRGVIDRWMELKMRIVCVYVSPEPSNPCSLPLFFRARTSARADLAM